MDDSRKGVRKEKPYNGKIKGDIFDVIHRCQVFASEVFIASAGAKKEYRFTICKVLQTNACELIYTVRQANSFDLYSQTNDRRIKQNESLELIERITDILPVVRRCKCITLGQEKELNNKLANIKFAFNKWIESDNYRLKQTNIDKKMG